MSRYSGDTVGMVHALDGSDEVGAVVEWYEQLWRSSDVIDDLPVLQQLAALGESVSPALLYRAALSSLFEDMGTEAGHDLPDRALGLEDSKVWNMLYRFQRDGVLGAIGKLRQWGGCIIADSVGLGKTFEALAVIRYFELRNERVLVLAPKRLRDNWTLWARNDIRNPLASDRFAFDVLNHTDLSRDGGLSGDIDLNHINWGNYGLVVIDESHNFRNRPTGRDGESRYDKLMRDIIKSGIRTRVLMLSATPVNNRLNDLKNQIAFATEGNDAALADAGIKSIAGTVRLAQAAFNKWQALPADRRTSQRLLDMLGFDYVRLLDLLTIARSRKHIERYYGVGETGRFPEKLPPENRKSDVAVDGSFPPISAINDEIRRLTLAAYAPLRYVLTHKRDEYDRRYSQTAKVGESVFRQLDREESLVGLMRVNLLKRMESSVHAFALTVERQLGAVDALIEKIAAHDESIEAPTIEDLAEDDPLFDQLGVGKRVKVLLSDADLIAWRRDLDADRERLARLLRQARAVGPERDAKLAELRRIIAEKRANPINGDNRKLLVFTAFADTAAYLYDNLADEVEGITALVTGTGTNRTSSARLKTDLATILTAFAPRARNRPAQLTDEPEIDLIIATDCISEGQNLQDCDCVVNYDIHWNPVRIVQRFGRIDRLGSTNERIKLVNFWPNMDLDAYIGLERTVSGRMKLLDVSATGEENIIEADPGNGMNDLEYRRRQLEAMQNQVIELEDLSQGVSITDLTLNDLRLDLAQLTDEERAQVQQLPFTAHSPVAARDDLPEGAIFVLRAETPAALAALDPKDPLRPHALIHVRSDASVYLPHSAPKTILDNMRRLSRTTPANSERLWEQFDKATRKGAKMEHWQSLLEAAIAGITGTAEDRAVDSLFTTGAPQGMSGASGLDDWEVIAWFPILAPE
ncbi:helicase-related protein [Erythrobacter donghaensis]|jgi:superfamily II DNA or RNA helicase|uniref:helicase-related protein n=1 Tax=Erythrobacter donghaensis TaxID=267135 RepID=UPI0009BCE992|nr:helicase-related protein [Erythrobacter donghaensis]